MSKEDSVKNMKNKVLMSIVTVGLGIVMLAGCGKASPTDTASIDDVLVRDHEMTTDITGCDSFTQIVDKLSS